MDLSQLNGKTALVVDDQDLNRELAACFLEDVGMAVIEAVDGIDAVEKFTSHHDKIDIVFMDIKMPKMDGYEATKCIRDLAAGKEITIIAITANVLQAESENCLAAGMTDYISKPISEESFYGMLNKWC